MNLNIVIPAAGNGRRFEEIGWTIPKPMISIKGKPLLQLVYENLNVKANYIVILQKQHCRGNFFINYLKLLIPNVNIILLNEVTEGAVCTILKAKEFINNDTPLLISNCDQLNICNLEKDLTDLINVDGCIWCMKETGKQFSYAKTDKNGYVIDVKEKMVISKDATAGWYHWNKGKYFVESATKLIENNDRTNNEFYVAPTYNYMIPEHKVVIKQVGQNIELGTPEAVLKYAS